MKEGRDVARKIKERYVARRRSASGKHWVRTSPDEGEGGGTGPELEVRSKDSQDGPQGLRGISSCRSSCHRVTPSSAPLPPIFVEALALAGRLLPLGSVFRGALARWRQ